MLQNIRAQQEMSNNLKMLNDRLTDLSMRKGDLYGGEFIEMNDMDNRQTPSEYGAYYHNHHP